VAARAGGHAMVEERILEALQGRFRGPLLLAGDAGYDEARTVFNALIDHRPALIARCSGAADLIAAVELARERDLLVSMKRGGHGVAGKAVCDGGLMIDPSRMKSIRVDPGARIVRAEPGVLGGELTARRKTSVWRRRSAPSRPPASPG
jgi:FAD/FMN-containing dehydrogenase